MSCVASVIALMHWIMTGLLSCRQEPRVPGRRSVRGSGHIGRHGDRYFNPEHRSIMSTVAVFVGSLRKDSFNRKMANALSGLAPEGLRLAIVEIGALPLYSQDDDVPGKVPPAWEA